MIFLDNYTVNFIDPRTNGYNNSLVSFHISGKSFLFQTELINLLISEGNILRLFGRFLPEFD
jgi:hypothetical protein